MVGNRGKRSRSKSKGLAPGPVGHEPLKINFVESSDGPFDGEDEKIDTSNTEVIPLAEEQMDEIISGFFSGVHEVNDQNAPEVGEREKDVVSEINVDVTEDVCIQEGTMEDVNEVRVSYAATDVNVVDDENGSNRKKLEEDEARKNDKKTEEDYSPVKFVLDNSDTGTGDEGKSSVVTTDGVPTYNEGLASSDHGIRTDTLENLKEPSEHDVEEPIGILSDRGEEHIKENASITNEVKEGTLQVNRPQRKVGKKKVVKKKIMVQKPVIDEARKSDEKPTEDEVPVKFGLDNNGASTGDERKSSEVTTEGVPANIEGLASSDHEITENMTDELENHNELHKLDVEEPISTLLDGGEEEHIKENASIINEVKEVTGQVNRPKKKVVMKKVVKRKMVRRNAAAANEEMPQPVDGNNASSEACKVNTNEHANNEDPTDEACKVDKNEHANNEEGAEVKPPVKLNRKRNKRKKKAPLGHSGTATAKEAHKPQLRSEEHVEISEPDAENDEVDKSGNRANLLKLSKKKKGAKKGSQVGAPKDVIKPKPSKEGKSSKRIDSMGMIFMCSSDTKKDCYRYKILGLPAGKKDMVSKIYKGMRLFLFDVDLRMMYGIYKAATPGGYNIEPRAFKSQFPSQVRFAVLEDCVPLAEDRFKKVLKDNYYTKNKFNCQLNSEQVKNLCKLFYETSKKAESIKVSGSRRPPATSSSARQDRKRKRVEDSRRGATAPAERERSRRRVQEETRHAPVVIDDRRRRRAQEELRHATVVIDDGSRRRVQEEVRLTPVVIDYRSQRRAQEEIRHAPVDDRYGRHPVYERETYLSSVPPSTFYQPLPSHSPPRTSMYTLDRASGVDPYRRDSILDHRDVDQLSSRESRLLIERSHHDPYTSYREPLVNSRPVYSTDARREHYDYTSDGRYAEYYRPAEYRPPPPLYRRY